MDKKEILPIDVNMPDLKGMLLLWKPTGPGKILQYYMIKIQIRNFKNISFVYIHFYTCVVSCLI